MITGSVIVMHIYTNNIKHALASTQNDHILLQINITEQNNSMVNECC